MSSYPDAHTPRLIPELIGWCPALGAVSQGVYWDHYGEGTYHSDEYDPQRVSLRSIARDGMRWVILPYTYAFQEVPDTSTSIWTGEVRSYFPDVWGVLVPCEYLHIFIQLKRLSY